MLLANPTPSIAYAARSTGSADVSSAAPLPPTRPATPSPILPRDKSQRAFERAVLNSVTPSRLALRAALSSAPHFALFMDVLRIAFIVLQAITRRMNADFDRLTLLQGCQAAHCLYAIIRIKLAVELHPERITPAEIRRLSKASRYINRLARRKIDFSPFLPTQAEEAQTAASQEASPVAVRRVDRSKKKKSFRPRLTGLRMMSASYAPGATLAGVCQTLSRLLKLLPDLPYDPEAPIPPNTPEFPSLPSASTDLPSASMPSHTRPATPSPSFLGARASSPAVPLTPANPAIPSTNNPHLSPPP